MPVALSNKSGQLLIVRLNSGRSLYLAPRERSPMLDAIEVGDNPDVTKLEVRGLLAVERREPSRGADAGGGQPLASGDAERETSK